MDRKYNNGDELFDRVFENALNGIRVETLSGSEILTHEEWVNEHWDDLNPE